MSFIYCPAGFDKVIILPFYRDSNGQINPEAEKYIVAWVQQIPCSTVQCTVYIYYSYTIQCTLYSVHIV